MGALEYYFLLPLTKIVYCTEQVDQACKLPTIMGGCLSTRGARDPPTNSI